MKDTIRTASEGITEELRKLNVGEVVAFPMDTYNPNSVRNAPTTTLLKDRLKEGKKWITNTNAEDMCIYVARVK